MLDFEVDPPEGPHGRVLGLESLAHTVHFESGRALVGLDGAGNPCRVGHVDPPSRFMS